MMFYIISDGIIGKEFLFNNIWFTELNGKVYEGTMNTIDTDIDIKEFYRAYATQYTLENLNIFEGMLIEYLDSIYVVKKSADKYVLKQKSSIVKDGEITKYHVVETGEVLNLDTVLFPICKYVGIDYAYLKSENYSNFDTKLLTKYNVNIFIGDMFMTPDKRKIEIIATGSSFHGVVHENYQLDTITGNAVKVLDNEMIEIYNGIDIFKL